MKKMSKKLFACMMTMAMLLLVAAPSIARAEGTTKTKVYYYNTDGWEQVNVWAWDLKTTDQLVANGWPGDAMTDVGNGWWSFEVVADQNFCILFNSGASGSGNQTADISDITPGATYWFTASDGETLNDSGIGGGANVKLYTEAQAGWPEGPAAKDSATPVWVWIAIAAGAVVVIGAVVVVVRKKASK